MSAALNGHTEIVQLMVQLGADVNKVAYGGSDNPGFDLVLSGARRRGREGGSSS